MDRPDILVMPPLAFAVALVLAVALNRVLPLGVLPAAPWGAGIVVGALVIAFAVYTNVSGFLAFRRAGTNVNPYKPALKVVRDGAFRYTRNPMYLGMVLFVLGFGLALSNLWAVLMAALLWAVLHFGVVLREERYMAGKFGDDYRELLNATRRWL